MNNIPICFMLIGLPASGKSFYADIMSKKYNANIHSSDSIREELLGDINCQENNDIIFKELHNRIKKDLNNNISVIFDACNISYKKRINFLKEIKNIACEKTAIIIATPYKKCLEQNSLRERKIPEYVIEKMYKNIYIAQFYEGWDKICVIMNKNDIENDYSELFIRLQDISQDNPHHELTIGWHCMLCASQMMKHQDMILYYASLFHDCGKEFTKAFKNSKGEPTDTAHFYQHHLVSAYNSLFYLANRKNCLEIIKYITWHMQPFFIKTEKAKNKFINLVGQEFYDKLLLLHQADTKAKSWECLNVN